MIAISPQAKEHDRTLIQDRKLRFEILDDRGNAYARELGLINELPDYLHPIYESFGVVLPEHNADGRWELPIPARFLVDRAGVIRQAEVNADYTKRPEPEDLLAQLATI